MPSSKLLSLVTSLLAADEGGYSLRMYWLGRIDKIQPREIPALEWITRNCLPDNLSETFQQFAPGTVQFPGYDHHVLARNAISNVAPALELLQAQANTVVSTPGYPHRSHPPCPKCGSQPIGERVGSYWRARCPYPYHHVSVLAHTMKTRGAALAEWDKEYQSVAPIAWPAVAIGEEVVLIRGSRGRPLGSGPGHERCLRARLDAFQAGTVYCTLLEDDPNATVAPFKSGESGVWHGLSFIRPKHEIDL